MQRELGGSAIQPITTLHGYMGFLEIYDAFFYPSHKFLLETGVLLQKTWINLLTMFSLIDLEIWVVDVSQRESVF